MKIAITQKLPQDIVVGEEAVLPDSADDNELVDAVKELRERLKMRVGRYMQKLEVQDRQRAAYG